MKKSYTKHLFSLQLDLRYYKCRDVVKNIISLLLICTSLISAQSNKYNSDNQWACIGPPGGRVFALVVNHQDTQIVFGSAEGGLFKTTDGGMTSELIDTTFPFTSVPAISPLNPDLMFYTLVRTTNGGISWDSMETAGWSYAFHPLNENIVYAINGEGRGENIIVSNDKGLSWDTLTSFIDPIHSLKSSSDKNLLFVKTSNKLLKSTDAGINWSVILTGLPGHIFGPYAVASHDSLIYLITSFASQLGNPIKFYRSTNLGNTWEVDSLQSLLQISPTNVMVIDPIDSDILYLARGDYLTPIPGDVLKSTNRGNSWEQKNTGLPTLYNRYLYALAINPLNPENLYVGSYGWGVYRTINGGESWEWTNLTKAPVFSIYIDDNDPDIIYACTIDEGVLKTTNKGWNGIL